LSVNQIIIHVETQDKVHNVHEKIQNELNYEFFIVENVKVQDKSPKGQEKREH